MFRTASRVVSGIALAGVTACAETSAPLPPPEEVVLVLNSTAATLSVVPVAPTSNRLQLPPAVLLP